jgi:hypothetical protein
MARRRRRAGCTRACSAPYSVRSRCSYSLVRAWDQCIGVSSTVRSVTCSLGCCRRADQSFACVRHLKSYLSSCLSPSARASSSSSLLSLPSLSSEFALTCLSTSLYSRLSNSSRSYAHRAQCVPSSSCVGHGEQLIYAISPCR